MTNSKYYSNYIKVSIIDKDSGAGISFMYDPPPLMWIFHNRTVEELEQELDVILNDFLHQFNTKQLKSLVVEKLEQTLRFWMDNGWLTIHPKYDEWIGNYK